MDALIQHASRHPARWSHPRGLVMLALGLVALAAGACGDGESAAGTPAPQGGDPVVVTDASGHEMTFEAPPQRIVSHSPAATEVLFAVGAGEQVIAVDEESNYPPEAQEREQVAYFSPDPERGLALEPDLVIFASWHQEQLEQFRDLDLPVLYLPEPDDVEGVYEQILTLGRITGHAAAAEALVAGMRERVEAVTARLADVEQGPRVYWELDDMLFTVGENTFIGSVLSLLKAQNVAAGAATAYPQLTNEALIDANPEVILLANHEWGASLETLRQRPGWTAIDAIEHERVYPVDSDKSNRPAPRIVEAMEEIAALLYPDRFD